ncbi:MAG: universal stress protein [Bryobacteraceae bacterium]
MEKELAIRLQGEQLKGDVVTLQKILFPVDFSDRCCDAALAVRTLALELDAEVLMLHVVETFAEELEYARNDVKERVGRSTALLERFLSTEFADLRVQREIQTGDAAVKIVEFARANKADLIMMPTHGYGPFRRFLLGSVTSKVLHDAECPVWTGTHLGAALNTELLKVKRVVCAVDLGTQSCQAARWASEFANRFGADLMLVHAVPLFTAPVPESWPSDWQGEAIRYAEEQLDGLRDSLKLECATRVVQGSPAFAIGSAVKEEEADLLVIGKSSHHGFIGRLGSQSYSILCHSPSPVVSV